MWEAKTIRQSNILGIAAALIGLLATQPPEAGAIPTTFY
jgi:hypothetical protein